jgi:hypothetical protein
MQTVETWRKLHKPGSKCHSTLINVGKEDILISIRAIQQRYRLADGNRDRWLAVQAAMSLGHCGNYGTMVETWGRGEFADIVNQIRNHGALSYFDRADFERWLDR